MYQTIIIPASSLENCKFLCENRNSSGLVCVYQFFFPFSAIFFPAAPPALTLSLFLFSILYLKKAMHVWMENENM